MRIPRFSIHTIPTTPLLSATSILVLAIMVLSAQGLSRNLIEEYESQVSGQVFDRNGTEISLKENNRGYYARSLTTVPEPFVKLLLAKEDQHFYRHPGIHPFRILKDAIDYSLTGKRTGSSTLTQQLVKILLGHENDRSVIHKLTELAYTFSLELTHTKDEILTMYLNSAYFGKRAQGIVEASRYYFNKSPEALSDNEMLMLVATLSSPSSRYPGTEKNTAVLPLLAQALGITYSPPEEAWPPKALIDSEPRVANTMFEINALDVPCTYPCALSIDSSLTETIRDILKRHLESELFFSVDNGAVVVIKIPENELLAVVGSPNPYAASSGSSINMALAPRPIGSTAKPFIYLKAFEKGARPYTTVEDKEYKYTIGTGFEFYPKNYDGEYRGTVTLHSALSNSLNVPSVKTLEYVGLDEFYSFLEDDLGFKPIQPLDTYALGIALGGLEMDLLTLSHFFTLFPNNGLLKPLIAGYSESIPTFYTPPQGTDLQEPARISEPSYTELINHILADREHSVDEFGGSSYLNLPYAHYALKTGTSRDYHDSWTIGYTEDFLVGVWVGNSDNTPMRKVSGQAGAGRIWHDVMELLGNSDYFTDTPFPQEYSTYHMIDGSLELGLPDDDRESSQAQMSEESLIIRPHDYDSYLLEEDSVLILESYEPADWYVNDIYLGHGTSQKWSPMSTGMFSLSARTAGKSQTIHIEIVNDTDF